jgi:hypothetical protein
MSSIHTGPTQIQYTIISASLSIEMDEFTIDAFHYLRQFPKDLLQLEDSEKFFKVSCYSNYKKGLNIFAFPLRMITDDAEATAATFLSYSQVFNQDIVKVFIIDAKITRHKHVADMLRKIPFSYFLLVGNVLPSDLLSYDQTSRITDVLDFIGKVEKQLSTINSIVEPITNYQVNDFKLGANPKAKSLNRHYPTHLTDNNFYQLNQILGNLWGSGLMDEIEKEDVIRDKRAAFQVAQIREVDALYRNMIGGRYVTPIESDLPPLVIAAPYHFPGANTIGKKKPLSQKERDPEAILKSEQNLNYTYSIESNRTERLGTKTVFQILAALTTKLILLDKFSYLHALLSFSPYYRLPLVGRSINADLSHFLGNFPLRKSAVKKINNFGANLQARVLDPQFRDLLKERNGQLVVVSDLPIEWLKLDQYPLALSHDICRVPEFNYNSLLNTVIHNQRLQYRITDNIISKTLVLHCSGQEDTAMRDQFTVIDSYKASIGFNSVICVTAAEIKAAIEKHQPELLIFDCHGNFDKTASASYLVIDERKKVYLTGEQIIKHGLSAPLVFVSACSTSPNYGFVKQLSDAFFQAGALSVTATYLPIAMTDATRLIIRLLNNLAQHASAVISSNWLAFVSHTIRAEVIYDAIRKEVAKKRIPANYDHRKIAEILTHLMIFDRRLHAFEEIRAYLKSVNPAVDVNFSQLDNEWLSYTIMGRADLLYFENWHRAHLRMHLGKAAVDEG